jgi:TPR repeat protein
LPRAIRQCSANKADECTFAALIYRDDTFGKRNPQLAFTYASRGCKGGDPEGCSIAGHLYLTEWKDKEKALPLLDKACSGEHGFGCLYAGKVRGDAGDLPSAMPYFDRACPSGGEKTCIFVGKYLADAGASTVALRYLDAACSHGNAEACYYAGLTAELSLRSALRFIQACNGGIRKACQRVGEVRGEFEEMCKEGVRERCAALGVMRKLKDVKPETNIEFAPPVQVEDSDDIAEQP